MRLFDIFRRQAFGLAILGCAAASFAFPSAFTEWGGVKLTTLVIPAIQIIMFGMGTTLSLGDFLRVVKRPWAVAAIAHNTIGYASGYWLTRLVGRFAHIGEAEARTVAIEVGMQNGGMAGALAVGALGSAVAALPANVFSIWMNFSGSIIAGVWSRRK